LGQQHIAAPQIRTMIIKKGAILMNRLKTLSFQHPVLFSVIIIVFSVIFTEIRLEKYFKSYIGIQSASYLTGILEQGLCSIILVALISSIGLLKSAGFTKLNEWRQLWLGWPILLLSILNGWSVFNGTMLIDTTKPGLIILYALLFLSIGLFEEILFRGVVLIVMLQKWGSSQKGVYQSVIISNLIFGLVHITNFFMGRYSLLAATVQTVYAVFIGVFFAACLLRNNSIWPVILLHAVFNMCGNLNEIAAGGDFDFERVFQPTWGDALSSIIVMLPLLIYGLFILRKVETTNQPSNAQTNNLKNENI
jgi:membrane protease YdiL (CAAX protease family)